MRDFKEFFLMNTEDVKRYAAEVLGIFAPDEETVCTEIGDGNINYVFRICSIKDGRSVVVKQADRLLRSSGRPLDTYRNKIEAHILQLQNELAPGFVPKVYHYDDIMCAMAVEDISDYKNLRKELMAGRCYTHLAENLSSFVVDTLLPTTDLVLDRAEKKKRVKFFTNIELCDITEDLVLTEPYCNYKGRNIITPGNEQFVKEHLYEDLDLHVKVAQLRNSFMNNAQALIHGDLHTGSIFANEQGIKVIDPEFAFYGPIGYDIGNVIGNLFFALARKHLTDSEDKESVDSINKTIADFFDLIVAKLNSKYDELVSFPLYKVQRFKEEYLRQLIADSVAYAGTEIIRRTVGDSKVFELTSIDNNPLRIEMERSLILLGIRFIKEAESFCEGKQLVIAFMEIK